MNTDLNIPNTNNSNSNFNTSFISKWIKTIKKIYEIS